MVQGSATVIVGVGFAKRLANLIAKKGLTLSKIRRDTNDMVSERTVSRWLNSKCCPSRKALMVVCDKYGWVMDSLAIMPGEQPLFEYVDTDEDEEEEIGAH